MRLLLAITPTVFFAVYGQLVTRWRVRELAEQLAPGTGMVTRAWHYLLDPYILSGYLSAVAGSVAWFFVVERQPLTVAFPVYVGISVLLVAVAGVWLFGESVTASHMLGMLLIVAGIVLVSR